MKTPTNNSVSKFKFSKRGVLECVTCIAQTIFAVGCSLVAAALFS